MGSERIVFSPVTRLSGLLSVQVVLDGWEVVDANISSTMFRGFEWIMQGRHITDAVYLTQRVCGICSLAHGAVASYLVDDIFDNDLSENAQYLRNIMLGADFLQNHIRHFYLFSLPDFVRMPDEPPFQSQNLTDARLSPKLNDRLVAHYYEAIKAAQESHQLLALFGGKAPHQHSFVHGGVSVAITADKVNQALALLDNIRRFVVQRLLPDTELIAQAYHDYFAIGSTPRRLLSFGLFQFGSKNERVLWPAGAVVDNVVTAPRLEFIQEDVSHSWYEKTVTGSEAALEPDPYKPGAYTWIKSVTYAGEHFQGGPLVRMLLTGNYSGGTATMDRIYARSLETYHIAELMGEWLRRLEPGPAPLQQKKEPIKSVATAINDAMRGPLLHQTVIDGETVNEYNIITPTVWNFSPKDANGQPGPAEAALIGTKIPRRDLLFTILGRIIRSFDPCLACATHVLDVQGNKVAQTVF
jgi:hydrogenase large subunit